MKNKFKKQDANGNQLPEQIGKGFNKEHWKKVKEAREVKSEVVSFKTTRVKKNQLDSYSKVVGLNSSDVMRVLLDRFLEDEVSTTKLDFIVQELTLKNEIISANERAVGIGVKNLEEHKSQLIDGGAKKDSPLVVSVELIIKNLKNGKK